MGRPPLPALPTPSTSLVVSDALADEALRAIQPFAPRDLTREEARAMASRLLRFIEILASAPERDAAP